MIKTAFFGTSDKSLPLLEALNNSTELRLCVTKTDRTVGRTKEQVETLVKRWALNNGIEVFEITKLDSPTRQSLIAKLKALGIDVGVVADFSFILHEELISTPKYGLINIHFSQLPKYRGASPVQHTILNGENTTAVTFMLMSKGMDEGDILLQVPYSLTGHETTAELYQELFDLAAHKLVQVVRDYINGTIIPHPQDHANATYCYSKSNPPSTLIMKEDAKIDWNMPNVQIYNLIRAFNPWPVAWTTLDDISRVDIVKAWELNPKKDKTLTLKIFTADYDNMSGLTPKIVQVQGGVKMDWQSFLNGYFIKKS